MSEISISKRLISVNPVRRKRRSLGIWILSCYTVLFCIFLLAPIASVVAVSFSAASFVSFPITQYSLRWYERIIEYKPFVTALATSLQIAFLSAFLGSLIGVPAALAVARSRTAAAATISNLLLAPISVPAIVLGFSLLYFLSAANLGISFFALLITHTVISIPYIARTTIAAYRTSSPDLEEAAAGLGASRMKCLLLVTLPLIRPGIFAGALFAFLISLDNLPASFFFGTANINTLPVVMLSFMQNQFDPSIAAISVVQMLITVLMLIIVESTYGIRKLTAV